MGRYTAIEARNEHGQTIAMYAYKGNTESKRIRETVNFFNKWTEAHSYKHHGDEVWVVHNSRNICR